MPLFLPRHRSLPRTLQCAAGRHHCTNAGRGDRKRREARSSAGPLAFSAARLRCISAAFGRSAYYTPHIGRYADDSLMIFHVRAVLRKSGAVDVASARYRRAFPFRITISAAYRDICGIRPRMRASKHASRAAQPFAPHAPSTSFGEINFVNFARLMP